MFLLRVTLVSTPTDLFEVCIFSYCAIILLSVAIPSQRFLYALYFLVTSSANKICVCNYITHSVLQSGTGILGNSGNFVNL